MTAPPIFFDNSQQNVIVLELDNSERYFFAHNCPQHSAIIIRTKNEVKLLSQLLPLQDARVAGMVFNAEITNFVNRVLCKICSDLKQTCLVGLHMASYQC